MQGLALLLLPIQRGKRLCQRHGRHGQHHGAGYLTNCIIFYYGKCCRTYLHLTYAQFTLVYKLSNLSNVLVRITPLVPERLKLCKLGRTLLNSVPACLTYSSFRVVV